MEKRPETNTGSITTTPQVAKTLSYLGGGVRTHSVRLSNDEFRSICEIYEIDTRSSNPLAQSMSETAVLRQASEDGLRIIAWLAKYVPAGTDPLKTLVQAADSSGWEVDPEDANWAHGDASSEEEE